MDSNHYRTGIYPTPSGQLKVRYPLCFVGMVRYHQFESHAYRRISLSASSRAANYAPHRLTMLHGELSATSPAHHRMAINHLLHRLIYDALLRTRCHTEGKYDYYSKSCGRSYLPFIKGFPCTLFFKVWASWSRTYEELLFPACPIYRVLWCILSEDVHQHYRRSQRHYREYECQSEIDHLLPCPSPKECYSYQFKHCLAF